MTHILTISGPGFALDGEPFDMWGIRLANVLENDAAAACLVRVLDDYVEHGINTFSVFLQGGSTGSANPFDADGSFTRRTRRKECSDTFKGHGDLQGVAERNHVLDRLAVLIEEADARKMVVNLGVFYQARVHQLAGEAALVRAVGETARWLTGKGYRNVFMDLVNEYGHGGFSQVPLCYGRAERYAPDGGEELICAFKAHAPESPVSISPLGPRPVVFPSADVALVHKPFPPEEVRAAAGRELPVVLNEWGFGVIGRRSDAVCGLYTSEDYALWKQTIQTVRSGRGFVFYHSQWKQHLTDHGGPHFELGPEDAQPRDPRGGEPSEHWYFDLVRRLRGL